MAPDSKEIQFLEGPQSRRKDFYFTVKVALEFIKGFRTLHFVGPCITIFGSARLGEKTPEYQQTVAVASEISKLGFTIMTGGGPGIMEAANRGAKAVGGRSVGVNIELPFEQQSNRYLDRSVDIRYFFVRKVLMLKYSYGFVIMPGGFGTLDEFFETITLIQTKKISQFPIVIMDRDYHIRLMEYIDHMVEQGTVSASDKNLYLYTDSIDEAVKYIHENTIDDFQLKIEAKRWKPFGWLFERS
ncbi:MAG: TIGR00730 family Rossman fold protein [Planctomycetota bacterium]|jgi:uncharacterized protein (TIGR00730 family)|nr:TIGR00730 family Rossman fold protein [Planctomycetota bacterium]